MNSPFPPEIRTRQPRISKPAKTGFGPLPLMIGAGALLLTLGVLIGKGFGPSAAGPPAAAEGGPTPAPQTASVLATAHPVLNDLTIRNVTWRYGASRDHGRLVVVEFDATNHSQNAIAYIEGAIQQALPGRPVPHLSGDFYSPVSGGINPGETKRVAVSVPDSDVVQLGQDIEPGHVIRLSISGGSFFREGRFYSQILEVAKETEWKGDGPDKFMQQLMDATVK
ncbi:hypothetical protein Pla52o_35510 [Novipirellula galeiformis]|uniref:DUF5067 domain-containing protein n=1 Tax=Novipirellula galeiformis TaxID=2528004 RepID=A0A5C6CG18_9BACT|nr:hypothetical protein [Novipirellula galeiformis]TWU22494.1 hypothetical protein Pla52o_35510 [Novipirellula galeiformis]